MPFLAWAPLGGWGRAPRLGEDEQTAAHAQVAAELGVSVAQVVLAWLLARSPVVMAIPGARRVETILDAIAAADLDLSPDHVALLG